uniref:Late embryogenesis abundant protein LEA-2 subgroup domain-containing protein n=1 Tax=Ananas comosus var. bracteatus TaxID=296719 RepID=A0A6V7QX54_ANACO
MWRALRGLIMKMGTKSHVLFAGPYFTLRHLIMGSSNRVFNSFKIPANCNLTPAVTRMGKDCGNHGECERQKMYRRAFACLLGLVIIVLLIILIVWLASAPPNPSHHLLPQPNDHIGIYYDRVDVYASYKYQQITLSSVLPPVYQGHNDIDVWSPYLYGAAVPVAPYLADALQQDCAAGFLLVHVKIDAGYGGRSGAGSPATTTSSSTALPFSPPAATAAAAPRCLQVPADDRLQRRRLTLI